MSHAITASRRTFLGGTAAALATAGLVGCATAQSSVSKVAGLLGAEGNMPQLDGATEWLNSAPLTTVDLRGKVVLVNFWTYTCINWLRQLPYVRAWEEKYREQGLVVLSVHTLSFIRALHRQRPPCGARPAGQLSDRDRQRLRGLERVCEQLLACAVLRRCQGSHSAPPLRGGRV
jgi:hypothetical protein